MKVFVDSHTSIDELYYTTKSHVIVFVAVRFKVVENMVNVMKGGDMVRRG